MPAGDPATGTPFGAVVTAAGSGTRLGAAVPKALVTLGDRTLVAHAVGRLLDAGACAVVVTAPPADEPAVRTALAGLVETSGVPGVLLEVVPGGATRQASVAAGLGALDAALGALEGRGGPRVQTVLVHDAARPLVPPAVVARVVAAVAAGARAVVPVVPVTDTVVTVRPAHGDGDGAAPGTLTSGGVVDRSTLRAVQTPQGFDRDTLVEAHRSASAHAGTEATAASDDAGLVARLGLPVVLVDGDPAALKVTTPADLVTAAALLAASHDPGPAAPSGPEGARLDP